MLLENQPVAHLLAPPSDKVGEPLRTLPALIRIAKNAGLSPFHVAILPSPLSSDKLKISFLAERLTNRVYT